MSIATGTGDRGDSGLIGGARVPKDHVRLEAYGTLDELNAAIGAALAQPLPAETAGQLAQISHWLFDLGADLATPGAGSGKTPLRLAESRSATLTSWIHELEAELPPLRAFILPGGTAAAAALHLARTVCRRAERCVVTLLRETGGEGKVGLVFLNRLGDLLFLHARAANRAAGQGDVEWKSGD